MLLNKPILKDLGIFLLSRVKGGTLKLVMGLPSFLGIKCDPTTQSLRPYALRLYLYLYNFLTLGDFD